MPLKHSVYAKIKNQTTNETRNYQTSPLTNYNILVFDQALKNNSAVSFINTNVMRAGGERDANVSALDMRFTGKKKLFLTDCVVCNSKYLYLRRPDNLIFVFFSKDSSSFEYLFDKIASFSCISTWK